MGFVSICVWEEGKGTNAPKLFKTTETISSQRASLTFCARMSENNLQLFLWHLAPSWVCLRLFPLMSKPCWSLAGFTLAVMTGRFGWVGTSVCVYVHVSRVQIRAHLTTPQASLSLITARQTNVAHFFGTLATAKDPKPAGVWAAHTRIYMLSHEGKHGEKLANVRARDGQHQHYFIYILTQRKLKGTSLSSALFSGCRVSSVWGSVHRIKVMVKGGVILPTGNYFCIQAAKKKKSCTVWWKCQIMN